MGRVVMVVVVVVVLVWDVIIDYISTYPECDTVTCRHTQYSRHQVVTTSHY